jgi:tRNA G26 N,N-dimethylase Trm1
MTAEGDTAVKVIHHGEANSSQPPPMHHNASALVLSGPMWTGPLHDREELEAMQQEAESRGWLATNSADVGHAGEPYCGDMQSSTSDELLQSSLW